MTKLCSPYVNKVNCLYSELFQWSQESRPQNPTPGTAGYNTSFKTFEYFTTNNKWLILAGSWTTGLRPATTHLETGSFGYNTTINNFESFDGSIWTNLRIENYADLINLPQINNVILSGNKTLVELGIQALLNYTAENTENKTYNADETDGNKYVSVFALNNCLLRKQTKNVNIDLFSNATPTSGLYSGYKYYNIGTRKIYTYDGTNWSGVDPDANILYCNLAENLLYRYNGNTLVSLSPSLNTGVVEALYIDSENTLGLSLPSQSVNVLIDIHGNDGLWTGSKDFTYSPTEDTVISATALYNLSLDMSNLYDTGRTVTISTVWKKGNIIISEASNSFVIASTTEYVQVPMNVNLLENDLQISVGDYLTLSITISWNSSGSGVSSIFLHSGTSYKTVFIRNGGSVTASNVFDRFNNNIKDQSTINHEFLTSIAGKESTIGYEVQAKTVYLNEIVETLPAVTSVWYNKYVFNTSNQKIYHCGWYSSGSSPYFQFREIATANKYTFYVLETDRDSTLYYYNGAELIRIGGGSSAPEKLSFTLSANNNTVNTTVNLSDKSVDVFLNGLLQEEGIATTDENDVITINNDYAIITVNNISNIVFAHNVIEDCKVIIKYQ